MDAKVVHSSIPTCFILMTLHCGGVSRPNHKKLNPRPNIFWTNFTCFLSFAIFQHDLSNSFVKLNVKVCYKVLDDQCIQKNGEHNLNDIWSAVSGGISNIYLLWSPSRCAVKWNASEKWSWNISSAGDHYIAFPIFPLYLTVHLETCILVSPLPYSRLPSFYSHTTFTLLQRVPYWLPCLVIALATQNGNQFLWRQQIYHVRCVISICTAIFCFFDLRSLSRQITRQINNSTILHCQLDHECTYKFMQFTSKRKQWTLKWSYHTVFTLVLVPYRTNVS